MSAAPELRVARDPDEAAREAAELIVWLGREAMAQRGGFRIALAGGGTPGILYRTLAGRAYASQLDWARTAVFFGDERCVAPDHPDSNFRMVREALLAPLGIDPSRVYRMSGEEADLDAAARAYERQIREHVASDRGPWPVLDVVLLGLGEDGHTASLFPDSPALDERTRLVVSTVAPREPRRRLTLTIPVLNAARAVLFLVMGAGKAAAVRAVLEDREGADRRVPARLIRPGAGRVIWFLDRPAASELTQVRQSVDDREE